MIIAWHGEPDLKAAVMERLREDRRMDRIAQKVYWQNGRGCNLGCLTRVNENTHEAAERLFGIEQSVGYWIESVFENLPADECGQWVLDNADAMPVGADMRFAKHELCAWLMREDTGLLAFPNDNSAAINDARRFHEHTLGGDMPSQGERFAARSAEWFAARATVRSTAWRKIAAKSLEIFRSCPVVSALPASVSPDLRAELCGRGIWCPGDVGAAKVPQVLP